MTSLCDYRIKKYYRYITSRCNLVFPTASNIPFKFSRCLFEHWTFLDPFFHCMPQKDPVKGHFLILFDAGSSRRKINRLPDKREKLSCGEVTKFQMVVGRSPTWFRSKELLGSSFKLSSFSAVHHSCLCENYSFIHLFVMLNRQRIPQSVHL